MKRSRIALLRTQILNQHHDEKVRRVLLTSLAYFAATAPAAPTPAPEENWEHARTLHPAALSGMMERAMLEKCGA